MKQILLMISFFLFASCTEYTVKVEADDVEINGEGVENGECNTYTSFLGLLGDFPLNIKIGEGDEEAFKKGNYIVGEKVKKVKEACEKVIVVTTPTKTEQTESTPPTEQTESTPPTEQTESTPPTGFTTGLGEGGIEDASTGSKQGIQPQDADQIEPKPGTVKPLEE